MRPDLPSGTVTFLFTDVEGSTRLLHSLGAEGYAEALAEHRRRIREVCASQDGVEVDTQGDAFFFAFATAPGALAAAVDLTQELASGPIRVRVGVHTGTPHLTPEGYVGEDVHRASRIAAAGHGGQVLVSGSTAALVGVDELRDLGEHRFKDLSAPERVYQRGEGDFPPLKSLYRTNMPVPATPFLGRARELSEVVSLLAREDVRLLTLTGPGGSGKTRLAIQAAAEASDLYPDGVHWVPLAQLRDTSLVPATVARALDVTEIPGIPIVATIVRTFAGGRALVLIDNCEHLIGAVASLAKELLDGCPGLVLAASSRERLGLKAERIYAVPPMAAVDSEVLFAERARAVQADFEADEHVPAICEALDHLPLAVELASARVRSLSTQVIRDRLSERLSLLATRDRDVEERQRTLEATIAWSYDLLEDDERRSLRALSVFAGGCTLGAAEHVAGADLDLLESLMDKSLIRHRIDGAGQDRYWMLETIREFAAAKLESEREREEARQQHAAWVLEFLRAVAPRWGDPAPRERLDRVLVDESNIRVALGCVIEEGDASGALELVGLIGRSWLESGHRVETCSWAEAALKFDGGEDRLMGPALITFGYAAWSPEGIEALEHARRLFRAADMQRDAAYATMALGWVIGEHGSVENGLELLEEALAEFENLGDSYCIAVTRANIDGVSSLRWPIERAEAVRLVDRVRDRVVEAQRASDPGDEIASLVVLSHVLVDAGDGGAAWAEAVRAATLILETGAGWTNLPAVVAALVRGASSLGRHRQALVLRGALNTAQQFGYVLPSTRLAALDDAEVASRDALDAETAARAIADGEAMSVDSLLEYLAGLDS